MKPRNKKQQQIVELSGQLRPLTTPQMRWAFRNTINHYAYRLKSGKAVCMDCGHEWEESREGMCICPKCGAMVEIKDTKERVRKDKSYFNVITTKENYQVIRMFLMIVEMRKGYKAKPAYIEIGQYWIDSKGHKTVIGLQRTLGHYIDSFAFGSPLEIRGDNEAFQHIAGEWVYPRIKVTDTLRRNGFKNSTHHIHPMTLFQQLLTNTKAETLMKAGEIELLRYLTYHPAEVNKYWTSIKIARRNGYKFESVQLWFDYIKMLERMGKDLNSPTLLMPNDIKAAHDLYVKKINRQREKERREADRQKAIEDKAKFMELKSRYFGVEMTDGEITLHTLDSIDAYYEIGEKMSLCVFSSRYYLKEKSLVLIAVKGSKIVGVVEISLDDYCIMQCCGFANGICDYSERIAGINNDNTSLIEERKRA